MWKSTAIGVGKSCLLLRFSDGSFTTSFITTIGWVLLQPTIALCNLSMLVIHMDCICIFGDISPMFIFVAYNSDLYASMQH